MVKSARFVSSGVRLCSLAQRNASRHAGQSRCFFLCFMLAGIVSSFEFGENTAYPKKAAERPRHSLLVGA